MRSLRTRFTILTVIVTFVSVSVVAGMSVLRAIISQSRLQLRILKKN